MINLFCGFDQREAIGFHVFCASVIKRASVPVRIVPMTAMGLTGGSNSFTLSRFLVPHLMGFEGRAIFADACDMLLLADLAELDSLFDPSFAVQVVKHPAYVSEHERKYIGTEMECDQTNYPRKNWASLMLMNCGHPSWKKWFRPEQIAQRTAGSLLEFEYLDDVEMGSLPPEWNVLIDEGHPREGAKLLHWTAGIPTFKPYRNARASKDWFAARDELMGGSE